MIFRYFSCISGGMVPSVMASTYPLMEVRGERKSRGSVGYKLLLVVFHIFQLGGHVV